MDHLVEKCSSCFNLLFVDVVYIILQLRARYMPRNLFDHETADKMVPLILQQYIA